MTALTVHNLYDAMEKQLQIKAKQHNCSTEEEVYCIVKKALFPVDKQKNLGSRLHEQIMELSNGIELELPARLLPRKEPNSVVIEWIVEQFTHLLYLPSIVKAEIEMGITLLDYGKHKQALLQAAGLIFTSFTDRCLPYDGETATHYAKIIAFTKEQGRPMSV